MSIYWSAKDPTSISYIVRKQVSSIELRNKYIVKKTKENKRKRKNQEQFVGAQ